MKKICIVGYNFGEKYQSFIPFYIYSLLYNYPDYSVIVFSDCELKSNVKGMINELQGMGDFEVIENYNFGLEENEVVLDKGYYRQALRWLFFDDRFKDFETIYLGDIDILFCKEKIGIYEQHIQHTKKLGLPYSNYVRAVARKDSLSLKQLVYYLVTFKFKKIFTKLRKKIWIEDRLSGLHFVHTKEYFNKVKPHFRKYLNLITGKTKDPDLLNDEAILYNLIRDSGIGLPPVSPSSPDLDYNNYSNIAFRPHHGIHLGIFRSKKTQLKQRQVLESYIYREYYKQYTTLRENKVFNTLISLADPYVRKIFSSMESYYSAKR